MEFYQTISYILIVLPSFTCILVYASTCGNKYVYMYTYIGYVYVSIQILDEIRLNSFTVNC